MFPTRINVSLLLQQFRDPRPVFLETSDRAAGPPAPRRHHGSNKLRFQLQTVSVSGRGLLLLWRPEYFLHQQVFLPGLCGGFPPHSQDRVPMRECSGPPGDGLVAIRHHFWESPDTNVAGREHVPIFKK